MPSLFRFLRTLLILGGLWFGALWALDILVAPSPQTMTARVPSSLFQQSQ